MDKFTMAIGITLLNRIAMENAGMRCLPKSRK
jgi:hypothetical protein